MRSTKAVQAANAVHRARKALVEARRRLAAVTRAGSPPLFVHGSWAWARRLQSERAPRLNRLPGVVGTALGRATAKGDQTEDPCLTVYVRRKLAPETLGRRGWQLLPRTVAHAGRRLRVDVVPVGRFERLAGEGVGSRTASGVIRSGTIGAAAVDEASGERVGVTAMHVTGQSVHPRGSVPEVTLFVPSPAAAPAAHPFGQLLEGYAAEIDAAVFGLIHPGSLSDTLPKIGRVRGWRPVTYPGDLGTSVRLFGARTGYHEGRVLSPAAAMDNDGVTNAIVVRFETLLDHGDSGAALVDWAGLVLGFLVGRYTANPGIGLFSAAGAVLGTLGCDIPSL